MATVIPIRKPKARNRLRPEPWGSKIQRAREDAGYTLRDLDRARRHLGFGRGPIHTLESMEEVPTEQEWRTRAYLLVTLMGYDPADFELGDDDAPTVIDLRTLSDLGVSPTNWYTDRPSAAAVVILPLAA